MPFSLSFGKFDFFPFLCLLKPFWASWVASVSFELFFALYGSFLDQTFPLRAFWTTKSFHQSIGKWGRTPLTFYFSIHFSLLGCVPFSLLEYNQHHPCVKSLSLFLGWYVPITHPSTQVKTHQLKVLKLPHPNPWSWEAQKVSSSLRSQRSKSAYTVEYLNENH